MRRFWALMAASSLAFAIPAVTINSQAVAAPAGNLSVPRALLVCNGSTSPCPHGVRHYKTVQAAVNAARPSDWVLIWPGVYHEKSARWPTAGVWIQKPHIHIRGLNRNRVIRSPVVAANAIVRTATVTSWVSRMVDPVAALDSVIETFLLRRLFSAGFSDFFAFGFRNSACQPFQGFAIEDGVIYHPDNEVFRGAAAEAVNDAFHGPHRHILAGV